MKTDISNKSVLDAILKDLNKVDFHKLGAFSKNHTVTKKEKRILSIAYLIKFAAEKGMGLRSYNDEILIFNTCYWSQVDKSTFKTFLARCVMKMGIRWNDSMDYVFKNELYNQFISAAYQEEDNSENSILINLKNGTYEINQLKQKHLIREFQAKDNIRYQLSFRYDAEAKCPNFDTFLEQVLPDRFSRDVLAEFIGSSFIRNEVLKTEKALILYGSGANGKSVVFEIVNALLGKDNITNFSLSNLTDDNGYYRAKLQGKLLNYTSEIQGAMNINVFKQLVSGERVEARSPYGQPFIIYNYGKFMFNCNTLPTSVEHNNAFYRRFIILPFNVTIPDSQQDKELSSKIISKELPGIFNWILKGLDRLIENKKYTDCVESDIQINEYRKQSNNVELFIDESGYDISIDEQVPLKLIYSDYKEFCLNNGYRSIPNNKFSDYLKKLGFEAKRINIGTIIYAKKVSNIVSQLSQPTL